MVGNPTIALDVQEKANFQHMDTMEAKLVVVDCERLKSDLDLKPFKSVQFVYLCGTNKKFKVLCTANVKIYEVHLDENRGKMSDGRVDHDSKFLSYRR